MPVKYEAPTIKDDESGVRRDSKIYTHPAYGVIGLSRCSCTPSMQLFGSSVKHSNFITLRIQTAERDSNGDYDFIHPRQLITEVIVSGNQLGEMLSSMNVGEGVPCTIRRRETDWDIPYILDQETPVTESRKSMQDQLNNVMKRTDQLIASSKEMVDNPKPLTKKDMKSLVDQLAMLRQEIHSNLPFVAKCFDEKIEKTIVHAKAEVEAFVSTTVHRAGLDAIAKGTYNVQLNYAEDTEKKELI